MNFFDAVQIGSIVIASIGGSAAIVFAFSSWLGKIWADRLMQDEKARHEADLEELRAKLHKQTTNEIEVVKRHLDIVTTSHLREIQEKLAIYRLVVDIVADMLADFDKASRAGEATPGAQDRYDRFNRARMKAYGYMAMLAPQSVVSAFDSLVDHLIMISTGQSPYEWPKVRTLVIALLNEARKDVGLDKEAIEYRGKL